MAPKNAELEQLEERIHRLESSSRRWRALAVFAGVAALGLIFFLGSPGGRVRAELRARRLTLVDEDGGERAFLSVSTDASTSALVLQDKTGAKRLGLSVHDDGSATLHMLNREGRVHAGISVDPLGMPRVELNDSLGRGIILGTDEGGATFLELKGEPSVPSTPRMVLTIKPNGVPALTFHDKQGKTRVSLASGSGAQPSSLSLTDPAGSPVFQAPAPTEP